MRNAGFTFIEVLVAMLIFVLAVLAAVSIADGSVKATREAREIAKATWLVQKVMVDLETKMETQGLDKACDKKNEGKFEAPYEAYTWTTYCGEIDLKLSQTAAQLQAAQAKGEERENESTKEDVMLKMILDTASDYISKSMRELHAEVNWTQGKQKRHVSLTTHFVRYDQQATLPGLGGVGGDGSSGSGSGSGTGGTGTGGGTTP